MNSATDFPTVVTHVNEIFLLLAAGEVLKKQKYVTASRVREFILNDNAFKDANVPLEWCNLALRLLSDAGFLTKICVCNDESYYKRG